MIKNIAYVAGTMSLALGMLAPALADTTAFKLKPTTVAIAAHPTTEAAIISVDPVEIPAPEDFYERDGHAQIVIHLNADGLVSSAAITKTCGFYRIDQNALKVVRAAKYTPAMIDGKAVESEYLVDVNLENASN